MQNNRAERFREDGYVVVPRLIPPEDVDGYTRALDAMAGGRARWTQPDGVNRHPQFWPLITDERLLEAVRDVLGPAVRYLPHNDLHVGFSSFSWHRDNVNRNPGRGADWDEQREPYRIARVGVYLQPAANGFRLGVVPGSHRLALLETPGLRRARRRTGRLASMVSGLSRVDLVGPAAEWLTVGDGDAVIFDPRLVHTGSRATVSKRSMFVAYGLENAHFRRHWHYYLRLRGDLGYRGIPAPLARHLAEAGVLASPPPADLTIEGAWMPSSAYAYVARRFTQRT